MRRDVLSLISGAAAACLLLLAAVPEEFWQLAPTVCVWQRVFDAQCLGCGTTRALSSAMHGRWMEAVHLNPLVVLALPALWTAAAAPVIRAAGLLRGRVARP